MMAVSKVSSPAARRLAPLLLVALALLLGGSCDSPVDYGDCVGGVVIDGVCEGRCTPEKCIAQNTCVANRCVLQCTSHGDCLADGAQSCLPATEDETEASVLVCQASGKPAGIDAPCLLGDECARWLACPDGGACHADQCGGDPGACAPDQAACEGIEGCTAGKCPDGAACRVGCATDCAPWLECQSIGEGDATAYCTNRDCQADDDCIAGFHCGVVRARNDLCGPACQGAAGDQKCAGGPRDGEPCESDSFCQKGNDAVCGETAEPCATPGQGGTTLFEGSQCLLRRSCVRRGPGSPCATDLDCSRIPDQRCASLGGELRCAQACTSDFDCVAGGACDLAQGACVPRFGAWVGTGQFCEPCNDDEDCGSAGSTVACAAILGGERACFDYSYSIQCTTDADCPVSPSGIHGTCLDEGEGVSPSQSTYHRCYLPIDPETMKTSCW